MARITVHIPDDVLDNALEVAQDISEWSHERVNVSWVVQEALKMWASADGRPEASKRGRTEALRAIRAARDALGDVEATLVQAEPVQRRVRRYPGRPKGQRGT